MTLFPIQQSFVFQPIMILGLSLILPALSLTSLPSTEGRSNFDLGLGQLPFDLGRNKSGEKSSPPFSPLALAGPNSIVPVTYTDLGGLWGKMDLSRNGRWFYAFLGIPYAEPVQRFQPTVPVKPWENIRDARNSGPICLQLAGPSGVQGEENCLFIDVYHPHEDHCQNEGDPTKLPVIVNIHGGGFISGAGSYFTPSYFMDECVVYATINYRLGAFGFLATSDSVIPGNLGLKDQILALQWVQNNIEDFRGDKNLVTVIGISAGGSSVAHLTLSPLATGLIHRGVAMSGNALAPWSVQTNPDQVTQTLADLLDCPTDTTVNLRTCLEGKPASEIIYWQSFVGGFIPFAPVIESPNAVNPFLPRNPRDIYKSGEFNKIPLICGFVEDEGIAIQAAPILADPAATAQLNNEWNTVAPALFLYDQLNVTQEEKNEISGKIREFYFGNDSISPENRQSLVNLYSDRFFVQGAMETVEMHSKFADAYSYVLNYKGGYSGAWGLGYGIPAVTHGDDAQFLFPTISFGVGTEQYEFSRKMIKYWTTFAKTGKPELEEESSATSWKPSVGRSNDQWFQLNLQSRYLVDYLDYRRKFWESVGI